MRGLSVFAALAAAALSAVPSAAAVYVASFVAGPITDTYRAPYGAEAGTSFTGSLRYDSDSNALLAFTFNAPERTFDRSEVQSYQVAVSPTAVTYFFVDFRNGLISSNNTAVVTQYDPVYGFAYCNNCVSFTSSLAGVPEPQTWALTILGFGAIGATMRSRRRARPVSAAA